MKRACTEVLIQEHKTILRAADVLSAMAKEADAGRQPVKEDVETVMKFLRSFADDLHQVKEESSLFPILMARCDQSEIGAVRHMVFEHNQDRSLFEGIEDALHRSHGADFAYCAGRLVEILRNHIYKEDNILFEMADRKLSKDDDNRILEGFKPFDEDYASRYRDQLTPQLRALEWKYLGKAA